MRQLLDGLVTSDIFHQNIELEDILDQTISVRVSSIFDVPLINYLSLKLSLFPVNQMMCVCDIAMQSLHISSFPNVYLSLLLNIFTLYSQS